MKFSFSSGDYGMGWMEFVSSLVGSLAWPAIILTAILIFRRPLTDLINSIEEARYGDTSVKVSRKIDKAEKTSENVIDPAVIDEVTQETEPVGNRFDLLMEISPSAAILEQWIHIEDALREVTSRYSKMATVKHSVRGTAVSMIHFLAAEGVVKPEIGQWLEELRQVRNAAAHAKDVSPADALRFQDLSQKVMRVLRHL